MFRALLTGHVLEGDVHAFAFGVLLGFALAHTENAIGSAAHAAQGEQPNGGKEEDGQHGAQECHKIIVRLVIRHLAFVFYRVEVVIYPIGRGVFGTHLGVSAHLFGTLVKNRADVFRTNR